MNTTLRKCIDCGKLFAAREYVQQCQHCATDERTVYKRIEDAVVLDKLTSVSAISIDLGVDASVVRRVLADLPYLSDVVENDESCTRCGIRAAAFGRDFCSYCMADVNADLRDMVSLTERGKPVQDPRKEFGGRSLSVGNALREKRRRTGSYRFNPVPPNIKGTE